MAHAAFSGCRAPPSIGPDPASPLREPLAEPPEVRRRRRVNEANEDERDPQHRVAPTADLRPDPPAERADQSPTPSPDSSLWMLSRTNIATAVSSVPPLPARGSLHSPLAHSVALPSVAPRASRSLVRRRSLRSRRPAHGSRRSQVALLAAPFGRRSHVWRFRTIDLPSAARSWEVSLRSTSRSPLTTSRRSLRSRHALAIRPSGALPAGT